MDLGRFNRLQILRSTSVGLFLGNEHGEEVLLPNKYVPASFNEGDELDVFVYLDHEQRIVATTLKPGIELYQFAVLPVKEVSKIGAFLNWGLEKDLFVPFAEQQVQMVEGEQYLVCLALDSQTNRLYASSRIQRFLSNDNLVLEVGQEVDLVIWQKTDLGYKVIVDGVHSGLVFDSDVHVALQVGDQVKGYVKQIRPDQKLDISLRPQGYVSAIGVDTMVVLKALQQSKGKLALGDKSAPDLINDQLGLSKKAFKRVTGGLFKQKLVKLGGDFVHWLGDDESLRLMIDSHQKEKTTPEKATGFSRGFSKKSSD